MKTCNRCKIKKDLIDFRDFYCKECRRAMDKAYRESGRKKPNSKNCNRKYNSSDKGKNRRAKYLEKNKIAAYQRTRISDSLRELGVKKKIKTVKLLGCSIEDLKIHLESLWLEGMTWDNYGSWHVDHIMPLASFNLSDIEQQEKAFHFSNLQPLWAKDNISKGCKIR